jgi:D-alanyl-D-alanine carboxypeptidase/D-alanyl-D-alanine-endopeptidase (penicillin-binding protein 4)
MTMQTPPRRGSIPVALMLALSLGGCATLAPGSGPGASTGPDARLSLALDSIFADTALAHAHIGIEVRDARTGETLYERNSDRLFVPASNLKLITAAAALEGLGPDFVFRTEIATAGTIRDGVLHGNLVVRGAGDPTLSERFYDDPRDVFRTWADSLRTHGITRIAGSIVGVDSAFPDAGLGAGWSWDDLDTYYAAEYGALQYNEGAIRVEVFPGRETGAPAVVVLHPATQYVQIANRTVTGPPGSETAISFGREEVGPGFVISGGIAADTTSIGRDVAVRYPTLFFLTGLREALRDAGIVVEGPAMDADELPLDDLTVRRALLLFTHVSLPLREILPGMMKPSQNWIAETLLLTVGRELRGEGTARAGTIAIDSMMAAWGLDEAELNMADGSGLSRYNLVSPDLIADLLGSMQTSAHSDVWLASLPVGGEDGTLERRMREPPLLRNVRAKTGSLSGVRALSGYLDTASGARIIFSTVVNNHARTAATVDRMVEAALARIAADR